MNRAVLIAVAGLVGAGCGSSSRHPGEIDVYWQFSRNVLGPPPSTVPYTCAQAGVDFVTVTDEFGTPIGPSTLDCTLSGVQGVAFFDFVVGAPYTFVVRGFSNRFPATPLFEGQNTITFSGGANPVTVTADGLQGTLTPVFTFQGTTFATCGAANVQRFDFTLRDGTGITVVSSGSVNCAAGATPGIAFGPVDLDNYFLSVDAVNTTGVPVVTDSICRFGFDHFSNDSPTIDLGSGECLNP